MHRWALPSRFSWLSQPHRGFLKRYQSQHNLRQRLNPLSIRIPLFDPDDLLNRLIVYVRPLFSRTGFILWSLVVGFACLLALVNFSSLIASVDRSMLATGNLVSLLILYPLVKLVHEFAHALAVKTWGGEVHEMGITLLILVPIPHVDATAAWAFRDKYKRTLVGAAGIMAELFLAAIALMVWLAVEPGLVRDAAFNVVFIGSFSTLVFNANPLLRFDGYYVLQDLIEIPNLSTRSNKYYLYLIQRYLFGLEARSPQTADGEHIWFAVYGLAAVLYRLFIMVAITLFLAEEYLVVGVALGTWAVLTQLILPLFRGVKYLATGMPLAEKRARAGAITLITLGSIVTILLIVPVSLTTHAEGVVWVPDQAEVFSETDGFVKQLLVASGDQVEAGEVLVLLENAELDKSISVLIARRRELTLLRDSEWLVQRVQSQITIAELVSVDAELDMLQERAASLVIRSHVAGTVVLPGERALNGVYLQQGQLLGYVSKKDRLIVRSVVSQADIGLLRNNVSQVQVRLAENPTQTVIGRILRETPAASSTLPSAALTTAGGGNIAVSRSSKTANERVADEKLFQVDIELPEGLFVTGLGERAYIRFDHGSEPLAMQWYRSSRQLLLSRLSL